MKASELRDKLLEMIEQHGDLDVKVYIADDDLSPECYFPIQDVSDEIGDFFELLTGSMEPIY